MLEDPVKTVTVGVGVGVIVGTTTTAGLVICISDGILIKLWSVTMPLLIDYHL
jgi:hypothetical protein